MSSRDRRKQQERARKLRKGLFGGISNLFAKWGGKAKAADHHPRLKYRHQGKVYEAKATQRPPHQVRAENRARNKRARRARRVNRLRSQRR